MRFTQEAFINFSPTLWGTAFNRIKTLGKKVEFFSKMKKPYRKELWRRLWEVDQLDIFPQLDYDEKELLFQDLRLELRVSLFLELRPTLWGDTFHLFEMRAKTFLSLPKGDQVMLWPHLLLVDQAEIFPKLPSELKISLRVE